LIQSSFTTSSCCSLPKSWPFSELTMAAKLCSVFICFSHGGLEIVSRYSARTIRGIIWHVSFLLESERLLSSGWEQPYHLFSPGF
jgi:hypothetical protein